MIIKEVIQSLDGSVQEIEREETEEEINTRLKSKKNIEDRRSFRQLSDWFETYFDKQMSQSLWQSDFKVSKDPYFKDEQGNALTYANIDELKAKAEWVRSEIKRLKNSMDEEITKIN